MFQMSAVAAVAFHLVFSMDVVAILLYIFLKTTSFPKLKNVSPLHISHPHIKQ